jgi:hypothetical protein
MNKKEDPATWHEELTKLITEKKMENEFLKKIRDSMNHPDQDNGNSGAEDETESNTNNINP